MENIARPINKYGTLAIIYHPRNKELIEFLSPDCHYEAFPHLLITQEHEDPNHRLLATSQALNMILFLRCPCRSQRQEKT